MSPDKIYSRLCVVLNARSHTELMNSIVGCGAGLIEHRMDYMNQIPNLEGIYDFSQIPIIATCRPRRLGGFFKGDENKRIAHLIEAIRAGAAYVDIELDAPPYLINRLKEATNETGSLLILSTHNWKKTPPLAHLNDTIESMKEFEPDIFKVITTAQNTSDILRILNLYDSGILPNTSLVAFAMGEIGRISRVVSLFLGAPFGYVCNDDGEESAPGQLTLSQMKTALEVLQ